MAAAGLPPDYLFPDDDSIMRRALQIALRGRGNVEPNPMVGAVIVDQQRRFIAEGWHAELGSHHAEIMAIRAAAKTAGARLFVTLEPCSHHGRTPPCVDAVIAAGISEVVTGCKDPAPHGSGRGIARLMKSGISVVNGVCHAEALHLIAPFSMLQLEHRPWVHAKWAMTLDGRVAASSRQSRWITCERSRRHVHQLRGVMDAVVTGAGTVRADNPELTARPKGRRTATRVVLDSAGNSIHRKLRLIETLEAAPVMICVADDQPDDAAEQLLNLGAEVQRLPLTSQGRLCVRSLLRELGRREMTHVLLEAGPALMGSFFDAELIDEVHAFISPKLIGGEDSLSPIGGTGLKSIPVLSSLQSLDLQRFDDDILMHGRIARPESSKCEGNHSP